MKFSKILSSFRQRWPIASLLLFLLLLSSTAEAELPVLGIPEITCYKRSLYHGGTQNWSISQSNNGLLYFANNDGIVEYDGRLWRTLPYDNITDVRSVHVSGNKIYVGTNSEFGYYEKVSEKDFTYHSLDKELNISNVGLIWGIHTLGESIVFQAERWLCIYKPGQKVEMIPAKGRFPCSFCVNDRLFVQDEIEGLLELKHGRLEKIQGNELLTRDRIGAIVGGPNNEIIIGTLKQGLFRLGEKGIEKWNIAANQVLEEANIFSGVVCDNDYVFGTIQSGIVIVDVRGNVKMVINKAKGLDNNTVLSLFVDKEKNVWAGLDNGIAKVAYHSPVSFLQGYFDTGTGYCIEKNDQTFYLGTNQGLYCIDQEELTNPFKDNHSFYRIPGTESQVWNLFKNEKTNEFFCGHNYGAYLIKGKQVQLLTPPDVMGVWNFLPVPGRDDMMISGTYNGLILFKRTANGWHYAGRIEGFTESSRDLAWDTDGGMWLAHASKGLYKFYFSADYQQIARIEQADVYKGLDYAGIFSLARINDVLHFVSPGGIYTLDNTAKTFRHSFLEKLFNNDSLAFPSSMKQDRYNNIWFYTNRSVGVLRYQEDGSYKLIYNPFLSLQGKFINGFESLYILDENNTIFGIEDGFAHYATNDKIDFQSPFVIHIRGFKHVDDSVSYYRNSDESVNDQLVVPRFAFANNAFEMSFAATWFGNGNVLYSSYLEGFDDNWSAWGDEGSRHFTRLPEGEYIFYVKAKNIQGIESAPASFRFVISPPWYRSNIAKAFYLLLILLFVIGIRYMTIKVAEKSKQREKIKQQAKFRETEERLKHEALLNEKEMIRLRNEKLHSEMIHKEKELANSTMHVIQKNDFLITIREELIKILNLGLNDSAVKRIGGIMQRIDSDLDSDSYWTLFETHLDQVHEDFLKKLKEKHPELMPREMRLCAYLRMGMSSKEIASLMNITARAVENNRYKLRKKMGVDQGDNLIEYITSI